MFYDNSVGDSDYRGAKLQKQPSKKSVRTLCMLIFGKGVWVCQRLLSAMASGIKPVVISGPSGGGKSTLLTKLVQEFQDCFSFSVSHTTRQPRKGEEEGKAYHFVTCDAFKDMIQKDGFLEHAEFSGNMYGTSKKSVSDIQETGRICILDVEVNGVRSIKQSHLNARFIFVKPPDMDVLTERLRGRGTETEESLQKRLDSAKEALEYAEQNGSYDHIIVNDDLEKAYKTIREILIQDIETLKKARST